MCAVEETSIKIRLAETTDAQLLHALGRRVWAQTFAADNDPADLAAYLDSAFSDSIQTAELTDPALTYLIAENRGGAVGYALLRRNKTSPAVSDPTAIELQRFYVDAAHHGRGIAQSLMSACVAQAVALKANTLFLGVWERNPRAIRFYEKMGFTTVGAQTFTVGSDVQQDLVLARPLP
jgi:diamine N-acetyltransferase